MDNECFECQERRVGCHSTCESYKKFLEEIDKKRKRASLHMMIGNGRAWLSDYKYKRARQYSGGKH